MTSAPALVPTVGGSRNRPLAWFLHGATDILQLAAWRWQDFLSLLTAGLKPTKQLWLTRAVHGCQWL